MKENKESISQRIFRALFHPIYKLFESPRFKDSRYFLEFLDIFTVDPTTKMLKLVMESIEWEKIKGDYLEFGVYQGRIFSMAFHAAQHKKLRDMNFYAFDSFQGLPKIKGIDKYDLYHQGQYNCNLKTFKKNLIKRGVDLQKVKIIPGWYNKTLNKETKKRLPLKKAAIIYIDCDLYESTVPVLNFIKDYLQDGTIIIFDDWFCFKGNPNKGEQRAFNEWLKKNPKIKTVEYQKFDRHSNSFIIYKSK